MTVRILTPHDLNVLRKIQDPESDSSNPVLLDSSLPRDPHVADSEAYVSLVQQERECIKSIMSQGLAPSVSSLKVLDKIIAQYPEYASARANRVQALRILYGDNILVMDDDIDSDSRSSLIDRAEMILTDLNTAISLLSPQPGKAIHPTSAKTLSSAYSQRGALYLSAANLISSSSETEKKICLSLKYPETSWEGIEFREAASRDFTMGGKYGNPIAKGLAVAVNPTAQLCGSMVREAMKKEYCQ